MTILKRDWIVIGILALSAAFTAATSYSKRDRNIQVNMKAFPLELDGWRGRDIEIDERTYELLETRNILMREYQKEKEPPVVLCLVFSDQNRRTLHPPEVCYQGDGYEILDKKVVETTLRDAGGRPIEGNELALSRKGQGQMALYWYKAGTKHTPNFYRQQWSALMSQISGGHHPTTLVRISTPLYPDEAASVQRMETLGKDVMPFLEKEF